MTNTKISVCTHKEGFVKSNEVFVPIYTTVISEKNHLCQNQIKI